MAAEPLNPAQSDNVWVRLRHGLKTLFLMFLWGALGLLFLATVGSSSEGWGKIDTWALVGLLWGWIGYAGIKDYLRHIAEWRLKRMDDRLADMDARLRRIERGLFPPHR